MPSRTYSRNCISRVLSPRHVVQHLESAISEPTCNLLSLENHPLVSRASNLESHSCVTSDGRFGSYSSKSPTFQYKSKQRRPCSFNVPVLLWMDEIHFAPLGNLGHHCWLVLQGIIIPGFFRWRRILSIHGSSVQTCYFQSSGFAGKIGKPAQHSQ